MGFVDEVKGIWYYNSRTHQVKTTRNYKLPIPREGEEEAADTLVDRHDATKVVEFGKRKREDNLPLQRSTHPRAIHDYAKLDEPPLKLIQLLQEEANECPLTAKEVVYKATNESALDEPKTLAEAKAAPDWPEWQKAINTELKQLKTMGTLELVKAPGD
ncbi:hypothetical protein M378DRAFT_92780 [Amanita muscaria Koide BX008]|uniref:Uncharacterized protein n=1 Tax=Amanita muscaria (strain Koide BX008) TaxID=946122 RepID=A0A0C2SK66_AMAMK|nr:hypothetical protein M378DRAFT_92780 [Amanita muscaria Koide BX008]